MKKNIIEKMIANIISQSKVLNAFVNKPKLWIDYASNLQKRSTPYHDDYYDDGYHNDRSPEEKECYCHSGCMDCLGFSRRDFT